VMSKSLGLNYDSRPYGYRKSTGAHAQRKAPADKMNVNLDWCNRMTRNSYGVKTELPDIFVVGQIIPIRCRANL
jgi:hypothetical protein